MTAPPSTITELRDVLIAYDAKQPRSLQTGLGPSELGSPCQAQIARKLVGAPKKPVTKPKWSPFQGLQVHKGMEGVVAFWNAELGRERWLAEDKLVIDDEISGSGDAYDTDYDMVVDWKHVGESTIKKIQAAQRAGKPIPVQVPQIYRVQGHVYGLGHVKKGRNVQWVRLCFLFRGDDYDRSVEWTEEYKPEVAFWALTRYYAIKDLLIELDAIRHPDNIGLVPTNPGEDCFFCPYRRDGFAADWAGCPGKSIL